MPNILVNGRMEIDDLNEGAEISCANHLVSATQVASRWYVQLLGEGAQASAQRVMWAGDGAEANARPVMWADAQGAVAACRITVTRPAARVVGLDRVQLFQPIVWDELFATALGADADGKYVVGGCLPLVMRFSIRTNVDINIGCTLNNGLAERNWTTNRRVQGGSWQSVEVAIPSDLGAAVPRGWGGFGLYYQIGLACGPDRLTAIDSEWNDGHSLMLDGRDASTFLTTEGATAWITNCVLGIGDAADIGREPTPLARLRVEHYEEKSYSPGMRPGTPVNEGAYQLRAAGAWAEDRVLFKVTKDQPPNPSLSRIYSPASGQVGCAYDVTGECDVPAVIGETSCRHMVVTLPQTIAGHVYRYHWRAAAWPPELPTTE